MKKEARQEVRRVLLGRTELAEDGRLVALEKGQLSFPYGIADGAGAVRILGIRKKSKLLTVSCSENKAKEIAFKIMGDIGRRLYLNESPQAVPCLIRYVLTRPTVLIFDYQDGAPILTAWSGRGLTGWLSNRRALNAFIRRMPGKYMSVSDKAAPADKDEQQEKKEKRNAKAAKQARKAERRARKSARKQKHTGGGAEAGPTQEPTTEDKK